MKLKRKSNSICGGTPKRVWVARSKRDYYIAGAGNLKVRRRKRGCGGGASCANLPQESEVVGCGVFI